MSHLGDPYVSAGNGPHQFDCSGLVYYCLNQVGVSVPRLSAQGYSTYPGWGTITEESELKRGDLLFFSREPGGTSIGHVAVYLGSRRYIHASSSNSSVVISTFGNYFNNNFVVARRVFGS